MCYIFVVENFRSDGHEGCESGHDTQTDSRDGGVHVGCYGKYDSGGSKGNYELNNGSCIRR